MGPRTVSALANDRSDKRESILDAALELFAERGFHGTAVPLVAEKAGVGAGTIYRYFESKEALVNALYQQWKRAMVDAVLLDFPHDAPIRGQFHAFWRRMVDFARENPRAFAFLQLHHHAPYLDERSRMLEELSHAPARALFDETRKQQITKDVPADILMALVFGAFVGVVRAAQEGRLALDEATLDQAESCLWEAIRR